MKHWKQDPNPVPAPEPPASAREIYTDLALEQHTLLRQETGKKAPEGVECLVRSRRSIHTTKVRILNEAGSAALGKAAGSYVTLETDPERLRDSRDRERFLRAVAGELAELMELAPDCSVLVVGLGNRQVAYDALGPAVLERLWITRQREAQIPEALGPVRPVSALAPGVLGQTGVESAELVKSLADRLEVGAVIVVDALAARNRSALGMTVQLSDAGLCPGSGVVGGRTALTPALLERPVFAVGVPMISTLSATEDFLIIPRAVEARTAWFAALLAQALNLALHPQLSLGQLCRLTGSPEA